MCQCCLNLKYWLQKSSCATIYFCVSVTANHICYSSTACYMQDFRYPQARMSMQIQFHCYCVVHLNGPLRSGLIQINTNTDDSLCYAVLRCVACELLDRFVICTYTYVLRSTVQHNVLLFFKSTICPYTKSFYVK
jgi:hypothetical protein